MALITCAECGAQVSDKAEACPHCGAPIEKPASSKVRRPEVISNTPQGVSPASQQAVPTQLKRSQPVFLILAAIAFFLTLTTPKFLLFFPVMGTLGFAVVSFFRGEKGRTVAVIIFALTLGVLAVSEYGSSLSSAQSSSLSPSGNSCTADKIEIKEVTWKFVDPCKTTSCASLVGAGTLINHCDIPIGVQIKLTGRGSDGSLVAVKDGWPASVSNIAPGEYSFPVDTWLDYDPAIETIEMSVSEVKQW
ncbi:MAG: zinc-ribbon domain-containing protein [Thiobacillus sp.]|nr:zinc-ribbon domain-containing protein [Thiobacillus sp.]